MGGATNGSATFAVTAAALITDFAEFNVGPVGTSVDAGICLARIGADVCNVAGVGNAAAAGVRGMSSSCAGRDTFGAFTVVLAAPHALGVFGCS